MTQERANEIFATELGQQLDVIYVTSDGNPFIRYAEALEYAATRKVNDQLFDCRIEEWFPEEELVYTEKDIENFLFWGFNISCSLVKYAINFDCYINGSEMSKLLTEWRKWHNRVMGVKV